MVALEIVLFVVGVILLFYVGAAAANNARDYRRAIVEERWSALRMYQDLRGEVDRLRDMAARRHDGEEIREEADRLAIYARAVERNWTNRISV